MIKRLILSVCAICFLNSCAGDNYDLYDKVGFEKGTRPNEPQAQQYSQPIAAPQHNQAPQVNVVPDYYYRQSVYPQHMAPASRAYNNPYSFQPPAQYPYYDSDQYYIPPSNSYSGEKDSYPAPSRAVNPNQRVSPARTGLPGQRNNYN